MPKVLWIKPEYLEQIQAGSKTVEIRVGYSNIRKLQPGAILLLNDRFPYRLRRISWYTGFGDLIAGESAAAIAPDLSPEELLAACRRIYPPEKEALGVAALEIEPA